MSNIVCKYVEYYKIKPIVLCDNNKNSYYTVYSSEVDVQGFGPSKEEAIEYFLKSLMESKNDFFDRVQSNHQNVDTFTYLSYKTIQSYNSLDDLATALNLEI